MECIDCGGSLSFNGGYPAKGLRYYRCRQCGGKFRYYIDSKELRRAYTVPPLSWLYRLGYHDESVFTVRDVAGRDAGHSSHTVRAHLCRLHALGLLQRVQRGEYCINPHPRVRSMIMNFMRPGEGVTLRRLVQAMPFNASTLELELQSMCAEKLAHSAVTRGKRYYYIDT